MAAQLALLPELHDDFRIDDATKAVGRRGIAEARATLAASRQPWRIADEPVDDAVVAHGRGTELRSTELRSTELPTSARPPVGEAAVEDRSMPSTRTRRAAA